MCTKHPNTQYETIRPNWKAKPKPKTKQPTKQHKQVLMQQQTNQMPGAPSAVTTYSTPVPALCYLIPTTGDTSQLHFWLHSGYHLDATFQLTLQMNSSLLSSWRCYNRKEAKPFKPARSGDLPITCTEQWDSGRCCHSGTPGFSNARTWVAYSPKPHVCPSPF